MRKIIATAGILAVMSTSVFAQATARPEFPHPDAVAQYLLKDGSTLYVYKDGKKIMMKGNELWRVESHRVNP